MNHPEGLVSHFITLFITHCVMCVKNFAYPKKEDEKSVL